MNSSYTTRLLALGLASAFFSVPARGQVLISGYMADPAGPDGNTEYIQLVAYQAVDFSITPFSVVVANNGTGHADGWARGGSTTFKFDLTAGTVGAGDVFYVGGSHQSLNGSNSVSLASERWIRTITVTESGGDGLGSIGASGVLGNGTSGTSSGSADGIAVFSGTSITPTTVPVDALFYGGRMGSAVVGGGSGGYELPSNDFFQGGKLQADSPLLPNVSGGGFVSLEGTFDVDNLTWAIGRSASTVANPTLISDLETQIGFVGTVVPEPSSTALGLFGAAALWARARRRA